MQDSKIAVSMKYSHDGFDTGRPLKSGMMAKFRLEIMEKEHFFLTIKVETEKEIPFGAKGTVQAVLLGPTMLTERIVPGEKLVVYGLPSQRVGTAIVESIGLV